jgi:hypothetical protein
VRGLLRVRLVVGDSDRGVVVPRFVWFKGEWIRMELKPASIADQDDGEHEWQEDEHENE